MFGILNKKLLRARLLCFLAVTACVQVAMPMAARANYPDRPIKIVVAWPPGGVTDVVARIVAEELSKALKESVVVENRPGANGIIGTQLVARSAPDGYTLQLVTADTHAINPSVYRNLPYNAERDFTPVALLVRSSMVLAAGSRSVDKDLPSLLADARKSPGVLPAGSYGVGSASHLALAAFEKNAQVSFLHVPYRGVSPVVNALAAGDISIAFVSPSNLVGLLAEGRVKILGSASSKRLRLAPSVPTFAEQGLPFSAENWFGLAAPKGLPPGIAKRLGDEIARIASSSALQDYANRTGVELDYRDSESFGAFLAEQTRILGEIARSFKIELSQ